MTRASLPPDLPRWRQIGTTPDGLHAILERPRPLLGRIADAVLGRRARPRGEARGPVRVVAAGALSDVAAGSGDDASAVPPRTDRGPISSRGERGTQGRGRSWEPNNAALADRAGVAEFDRAYAVDPVMEAGRLSMVQPVLAASWRAAPRPGGSPEIAEWVDGRLGLAEQSGLMAGGWQLWLEATLTHGTRTGTAPSEIVPWVAEDGGYAIDLLPIHPATLAGYRLDAAGGLEAVEQGGRSGSGALGGLGVRALIPGDLSHVWVHGRLSLSDFWGRPMGRGAWRGYQVKSAAWIDQAIANERWGSGIPMAEIARETWDALAAEADRTALVDRITDVLRQLRAGEQAFLNPGLPGVTFSMFGRDGGGTRTGGADLMASIVRADHEILLAHMAPDLALGSTETGARALGEHFATVRQSAIRALADSITEGLTGPAIPGHGAVTRLVQWEFGVGPGDVPTIEAENLADAAFVGALSTLPALVSAGLLTPDAEAENAIRQALDMPEIAEQARRDQRGRVGRLRAEAVPIPRIGV